ncbi:MAG: cobalt transporter [Elusimicrobia bacterium]|nr:cobalt transporter [Elusimicrobiota bacterium]
MKRLIFVFAVIFVMAAGLLGLCVAAAEEEGAWPGVDVAVVGKYAEKYGRPPRPPLINVEGDALLFAFTLAGTVSGFIFGYNWRKLFSK